MNKNIKYQQIWDYLSNRLMPNEEDALMDWMAENADNELFFKEVLDDFNSYHNQNEVLFESPKKLFNSQKNLLPVWVYAAASVIVFSIFAWILFVPKEQESSVAKDEILYLNDSTQILLSSGSELIYDPSSFDETKAIKIKGYAKIILAVNQKLLIETNSGYFLADKGSFSVKNPEQGKIEFTMEKGEAHWISHKLSNIESNVSSGERITIEPEEGTFFKQNHQLSNLDKKYNNQYIINNLFLNTKI